MVREAVLQGRQTFFLPASTYAGHKHLAEA